ncbi:MAG: oligosaccharide flippase family protein [Methanospirillum sp.]
MRNLLSWITVRLLGMDLREFVHNPLYQNSAYLTLGRFVDTGVGFFFWTLAARLYSVADVGIATALVSSLGLIMAFSRLGLDAAIVRFMPTHDYGRVFNTCLWITTAAGIVVGLIYLGLLDYISPELVFIREYAGLFILFVAANAITLTTGNALLTLRRADQKLIQNLIMGGRLLLLFPLALFGSLGIFDSFGLVYALCAIYGLLVIRQHLDLSRHIDKEFTRSTFRFSLLNHIATILQNTPALVMPLLIVNILGPEDAALYYVAFAIGSIVLIIPDAMSTSFFVEGSHGMDVRKGVINSLSVTYAVLIPAIILIILFGDRLLALFGEDYVTAFGLLQVFAVSSLFVTLFMVFIPLQNIRLKVNGIVFLNLVRFVLLVGLSYVFMIRYGVIGAGYAWAVTYIVLSVYIVLSERRGVWKRSTS